MPEKLTYDAFQEEVINLNRTRAIVLAAPGCGKTELLSRRIIKAREEYGVDCGDMICLTFTNRASREMKERIEERTEGSASGLFVGNVHRFCAKFIFENGLVAPDTTMIDEQDTYEILDEAIHVNERDFTKVIKMARDLRQSVENHPIHVRTRSHLSKDFKIMEAAGRYLDYKETNRLIDFDDLLIITYTALMKRDEGTLDRELKLDSFKWVQVDEIQDLNPLQLAIVDKLTSTDTDSTAVFFGDECQSIFSFIGSGDYEATRRLKKSCGNRILQLPNNYRAPRYMLDMLNIYAVECLDILPEDLPRTDNNSTTDEGLMIAEIPAQLTPDYIAGAIRRRIKMSPDESIAVLFRTNRESLQVSELLSNHFIKHIRLSESDTLKSVTFKTLLAHFNVAKDPGRMNDWARILYQSGVINKLGDSRKFCYRMRKAGLNPIDIAACGNPSEIPGDPTPEDFEKMEFMMRKEVKAFRERFIKRYIDIYKSTVERLDKPVKIAEEFRRIYLLMLDKGYVDPMRMSSYVMQLIESVSRDDGQLTLGEALESHLVELHTFNEGDLYQQGIIQERVHLMTVHKAKGLEFENVIVCNVNRDRFPLWSESEEESKRILYVAMSRARRRLLIVHSESPSRFFKGAFVKQFDKFNSGEIFHTIYFEGLHGPKSN